MVRGVVGAAVAAALMMGAASARAAEDWSYSGNNGPDHWPGVCATGTMQSPIDIHEAHSVSMPTLGFHYSRSRLRVSDDGHSLNVDLDQGSFLRLGAERYELQSIDFHTPGEERVEGKGTPLSAHLVHESTDGKIAVVVVRFVVGPANPVLDDILEHLPPRQGQVISPSERNFNAERLLPTDLAYYTYEGSLTTPPCTEDVRWLVLREIMHASPQQLDRLSALHPNNARPVQPTNGRDVRESE